MNSENDKGMLYGATGIALFVVIFALFKAKAHFAEPATERELVAHLRNTTPQPELVTAPRDYADSERDHVIEEYVQDSARDLEAGITQCLKRWPEAPSGAKARLRTDAAGRLEALSIQGATPEAEACIGTILKQAILPRRSDAVIRLEFPNTTPADGANNPVKQTGGTRTVPNGDIYWGDEK
jgi:hypothetical protein